MEAKSDNKLVSNHLISDGTEDVVLLDSAETISADLTEATNEDKKINLRSATAGSTKETNKDQDINLPSAKDEDVDSTDDGSSADASNDDDDDGGKKNESQNDGNRKHEVIPASTDVTKCEFP